MKNLIVLLTLTLCGLSYAHPCPDPGPQLVAEAGPCYWCNGSGKCQHDWPLGSGKDNVGGKEYFC